MRHKMSAYVPKRTLDRSLKMMGAQLGAPTPSRHAPLTRLVARVSGIGLFDLLKDLTEVIGLGACSGGNFSYDDRCSSHNC